MLRRVVAICANARLFYQTPGRVVVLSFAASSEYPFILALSFRGNRTSLAEIFCKTSFFQFLVSRCDPKGLCNKRKAQLRCFCVHSKPTTNKYIMNTSTLITSINNEMHRFTQTNKQSIKQCPLFLAPLPHEIAANSEQLHYTRQRTTPRQSPVVSCIHRCASQFSGPLVPFIIVRACVSCCATRL